VNSYLRSVVIVFCGALLLPIAGARAQAQEQSVVSRVTALERRVAVLEEQVTSQRSRISTLEEAFQPQSVAVNCAEGQTVGQALAQTAGRTAPLTIRVVGVCTENVVIGRDDVTLVGNNRTNDRVQALLENKPAVSVSGGQRVTIRELGVQGGSYALSLGLGAVVGAHNIDVNGGVNVISSVLQLDRVVVEGMVSASAGSVLRLDTTTVQNGPFAGVVIHDSNLFAMASTIRDHRASAISAANASLWLDGGTLIERNGIFAGGGSSIHLGRATIRGSSGFGIFLGDTSVVGGNESTVITGNAGWGIECQGSPALPQIASAGPGGEFSLNGTNVFGNTRGQINCPGIVIQ